MYNSVVVSWTHVSGLFAVAADLERVDAVVRMKLAKLLDPVNAGSDWRELAARLGFSQLTAVFQLQKNPTRCLLDNYEVLLLTSSLAIYTCTSSCDFCAVNVS